MSAVLEDRSESTRHEEHALERAIRVLCEQVERLTDAARRRGELQGREADWQLQAFLERRHRARQILGQAIGEPPIIRIARLQQIADALDCSRSYFARACQLD